MSEPMTVRVEVWPLGADETGVWLLGLDAWRPALPVMADSEPHTEVVLELARHGLTVVEGGGGDVPYLHQTSARTDDTSSVQTYMAVVACKGPILEHWPNAVPISAKLARHVGQPPTHAANGAPMPRHIDVLLHGIRHIRRQLDTNDDAATVLSQWWPTHLSDMTPELARMYRRGETGGASGRVAA